MGKLKKSYSEREGVLLRCQSSWRWRTMTLLKFIKKRLGVTSDFHGEVLLFYEAKVLKKKKKDLSYTVLTRRKNALKYFIPCYSLKELWIFFFNNKRTFFQRTEIRLVKVQ